LAAQAIKRLAGFPRAARLLKPADFKRVISKGRRRRSPCFTAYEFVVAAQGPEAQLPASSARMGLAVSKKAMPRAVDRNRFKRLVRESFRKSSDLPVADVVIMATPRARKISRPELAEELSQYWIQLRKRWPVS
tara:strand:- start:23982 stop:24383 length:402 start_codon:yes stop_codon:yes gene_type:complete